jgi:hypothetical protein
MQIIPHFFFVFPPPRLTSPASATSSAIVPRPALLSPYRLLAHSPQGVRYPIPALSSLIISYSQQAAREIL